MKTKPNKVMKIILCLTPTDIYIKEITQITMVLLHIVGIEPTVEQFTCLWTDSCNSLTKQALQNTTDPHLVNVLSIYKKRSKTKIK